MKAKLTTFLAAFIVITCQLHSQTTAMNFNRNDCNGNPQHLFADLNSGKAVIIEYFMTSCAPCPAAGQKLEAMKANLLSQYPGMIKSYAIAFNNTYSPSVCVNWVQSNGFTAIPMDSGATQVAYYGGMGMPTIVIAAGSNHQLLGSPYIGFNTSDTTQMASDIRAFLNAQVGIKEDPSMITTTKVYPNPANHEFNIELQLKQDASFKIELLDMMGRRVMLLENEKSLNGKYSKTFSLNAIPKGNYLVRISSDNVVQTHKLTIAK